MIVFLLSEMTCAVIGNWYKLSVFLRLISRLTKIKIFNHPTALKIKLQPSTSKLTWGGNEHRCCIAAFVLLASFTIVFQWPIVVNRIDRFLAANYWIRSDRQKCIVRSLIFTGGGTLQLEENMDVMCNCKAMKHHLIFFQIWLYMSCEIWQILLPGGFHNWNLDHL